MRRLQILLTILALSLPFALPAAAQTPAPQPACSCFCRTSAGASGPGGEQQGKLETSSACAQDCSKNGNLGVSVCASDASQFPSNNPFCYTQDECESQRDGKGRPSGTWDGNFQPPECVTNQRYCYPRLYSDIQLSFALGSVNTVSDLGDYIGVAYNVLLGIATTIAIVMLMVGGFQYVLGAGAPEQLAKGKARMKNAVIGLVLLLSAYVILFTVNPQLIKLQPPAVRMTKGIQFVSPATSCDTLTSGPKPFTLDTANTAANKDGRTDLCGAVAPVLQDGDGKNAVAGSTCQYTRCDDPQAHCAGTGKNATCVKCEDVVGTISGEGLSANETLCNSLSGGVVRAQGQVQTDNECWFSKDRSVAAPGPGACVGMTLDCTQVHTCDDYGQVKINFSSSVSSLLGLVSGSPELFDIEPTSSADTILGKSVIDRVNIKTVCEADACAYNRTDGGHCVYTSSIGDHCDPSP